MHNLAAKGASRKPRLVVRADRRRRRRSAVRRNLLILVLQLIELVVDAALREQLLVRAHLADLPLMHNDDLVGALNGREAMRDDQRRSSFNHAVERVAHAKFSFGVDA